MTLHKNRQKANATRTDIQMLSSKTKSFDVNICLPNHRKFATFVSINVELSSTTFDVNKYQTRLNYNFGAYDLQL